MSLCQTPIWTASQEDLLAKAQDAFERGDFEAGHTCLLQGLEADTAEWIFHLRLAQALLRYSQSPEKAVLLLEEAAHLAPHQPEIWMSLGQAYQGVQAFEKALQAWHRVLSLPASADAHLPAYVALAELLEAQGFLEEAASAWQQAVDFASSQRLEITLKAYPFYIRHDAFEDALTLMDKALIQDPEEGMLYFLKGVCLERLERSEEATQAYGLAQAYGQAHPELHRQMASYFAQAGDLNKAVTHLVSLLELLPEDAEALEALAHVLRQLGRTEASLHVLERLTQAHPQQANAWIHRGEIHDRLGHDDAALYAYNQALALTGNRALQLRKALLAPPLPPATEDALFSLQNRLELSLKTLAFHPPFIENPALDLGVTPQHLKDQGVWNDTLEALWKKSLSQIQYEKKSESALEKRDKIQIVILTRAFQDADAPAPSWMPPLNALDRHCVQIHWLVVGSSLHAPKGTHFHEADTQTLLAPYEWKAIQNTLHQFAPDVLVLSDAQRDVVSLAVSFGEFAPLQVDLATLQPALDAPLRPLASTSRHLKEDFGSHYDYLLLTMHVQARTWHTSIIRQLDRWLRTYPKLQVVLYYNAEASLVQQMQARVLDVLQSPEQNARLIWMPLAFADGQALFQVADAVWNPTTEASSLILQAEAFGTPIFDQTPDSIKRLTTLFNSHESERQSQRNARQAEISARFSSATREAQARHFQNYLETALSCV